MHAAVTDGVCAARRERAMRLRGLYAVTSDTRDTSHLCANVSAALAGGAAAIQYRNKTADARLRRAQALALAPIVAAHGALFIVNDDPALARDVGADGVHIGEDDPNLDAARTALGPDAIVGVSCHDDPACAERAVAAGADYVAFGSFFPSPTKPAARRADPSLLRRAAVLGVPRVAIGGITSTNARALIDAGADAVAVISDVFERASTTEIERAAAAIAALFGVNHRSQNR